MGAAPGAGDLGFDHDFANHGQGGSFNTALDDHVSNIEMDQFAGSRRLFDFEAATDQLLLSYDHCDVYDGGQSCLGGGYRLVDAVKGTFEDDVFDPNGSTMPMPQHRLTKEQLEIVKQMAADPKRRMFGVHVTNHGLIHLKSEFKRIAEDAGCVRIDQVTPNFFASDTLVPQLADWNIWKPPFSRKRVPAGFYPKATGTTRIWKQYWQVKHSQPSGWFIHSGPKHDPNWRFDRFCNTILEVTCVTWYFREACDYETRFHINVISLPYLDPYDKQWGYLKEPFERYQKMAKKVCEAVLHRLKACPPHPVAVKNRGDILKRVRDEAEARRLAGEALKNGGIIVPTPPPLVIAGNGCTTASGADLIAALGDKPELVRVKLILPRRG
jgi:hypothetical protein